MATAVDKQQNLLMSPQRVNYPDLADWIALELQPMDAIVLDACGNARTLCDQLAPQVSPGNGGAPIPRIVPYAIANFVPTARVL